MKEKNQLMSLLSKHLYNLWDVLYFSVQFFWADDEKTLMAMISIIAAQKRREKKKLSLEFNQAEDIRAHKFKEVIFPQSNLSMAQRPESRK